MKKSQSRLQSKPPADLLAAVEKQKKLVAQQERRGNLDTYDHTKLARLETAVAAYQNKENEVE